MQKIHGHSATLYVRLRDIFFTPPLLAPIGRSFYFAVPMISNAQPSNSIRPTFAATGIGLTTGFFASQSDLKTQTTFLPTWIAL